MCNCAARLITSSQAGYLVTGLYNYSKATHAYSAAGKSHNKLEDNQCMNMKKSTKIATNVWVTNFPNKLLQRASLYIQLTKTQWKLREIVKFFTVFILFFWRVWLNKWSFLQSYICATNSEKTSCILSSSLWLDFFCGGLFLMMLVWLWVSWGLFTERL